MKQHNKIYTLLTLAALGVASCAPPVSGSPKVIGTECKVTLAQLGSGDKDDYFTAKCSYGSKDELRFLSEDKDRIRKAISQSNGTKSADSLEGKVVFDDCKIQTLNAPITSFNPALGIIEATGSYEQTILQCYDTKGNNLLGSIFGSPVIYLLK
jgi:hypothetical protein